MEKNVPSREQLIREVEELRSRLQHLENLNRDHQGAMDEIWEVTEPKRGQAVLRESEFRFHQAFESAPIPMGITRADGTREYLNPAFTATFGYTLEDVPTISTWTDRAYPDPVYRRQVMGKWEKRVKEAKASNRPMEPFEVNITCKDGTIRFVEVLGAWMGNRLLVFFNDITHRKRAEAALKESEKRFSAFMRYLPGFAFLKDHKRRALYVNEKFATAFGRPMEQWLGRTNDELWPDNVGEKIRLDDEAVMSSANEKAILEEIPVVGGELRAFHTIKFPIPRPDGPPWLGGISVDITDLRRAEDALIESEQKYRTLVEHLPQHIFVKNRGLVYQSCNLSFAESVGRSVEEVLGHTDFEIYANRRDAEKYRAADLRVIKSGYGERFEEQYDLRGERRWARTIKVPFRNEAGSIIGVVGILEDITEWREAQERLKISEKRYRAVSELSSDYSFAFRVHPDRSPIMEWITDAFTRMTGFSIKDLKAPNDWMKAVHPEDLPTLLGVPRLLISGQQITISYRLIGQTGHPFWVKTYIKPELDARGVLVRFYGATQNIHREKMMEDALKEERERLKQASFYGRVALWQWNFKEGTLEWSDFVDDVLGYDRGEFPRTLRGWFEHIHPEDQNLVKEELGKRISGWSETEDLEYTVRMRRKDGAYIWWHNVGRILSVDGQVVSMSGACTDITKQKEAEALILNSLKEKEILLQEVHHRVKNNLQIISSLLDLHSGDIHDRSVQAVFNESKKRVLSIALIHERLYRSEDFARVDIARYTENLLDSLMQSYGEAASVDVSIDIYALYLDLDAAVPCGLIINELVMNCVKHAFPDGRKGSLWISMGFTPDNLVELRVKDNGIGFPRDYTIDNPQTLGLTIVATLVRQLRGRMEIRSDGGGEIIVVFPVSSSRKET